MGKNKLLFTLFLFIAVFCFCCDCGNIRNVEYPAVIHPASSTSSGNFASPLETREAVPETYFQNGRFQPLYTGPPFPVFVDTHVVRGGFIKVTLKAMNTINYEITYNNADGWVSNVRPTGQTQSTGTPEQMATEAKLKNIIANCQQIAFEKDGRIQFITDNGSSRISFDRLHLDASAATSPYSIPVPSTPSFSVETRRIVPETYFQNGRFQPLFMGPPFPITLDTHIVQDGFIKVTLKAISTINYEIAYNAHGWVSSVKFVGEIPMFSTPDQKAAEDRVKYIIANCQKISFEIDGRIQFIANSGSARISFMI